MKKRILSILLATTLILAMAIPASAASRWNEGTYGNCTYSTFAQCTSTGWHTFIELNSSTDSWTNYTFQSNVSPCLILEDGTISYPGYFMGNQATMIGSNSRDNAGTMKYITAKFKVNGVQVDDATVYPG